MINKKVFKILLFYFFILKPETYDAAFIGFMNPREGIGNVPIQIIDCLKYSNLKINWISIYDKIFEHQNDIPSYVKRVAIHGKQFASRVGIYTSLLWYKDPTSLREIHNYQKIPNNCSIKIAYSMLESTRIPQQWANILNKNFDAVVVPDDFLGAAYYNSGVNIPIFTIPLPLNMNELKANRYQKKPIFTFGSTNSIIPRKNYLRLIEAFFLAFGNSKKVQLKINGSGYEQNTLLLLTNKVKSLKANNIIITTNRLDKKNYIAFLKQLDCFVSLSMGEGFAITPREALALGIPVILTNNSAHKTICNTGLVKSIASEIHVPYTSSLFNNHMLKTGYVFDCSKYDAANALKEVFNNFDAYLSKSNKASQWVDEYSPQRLCAKYVNLIKPKKIILANQNIVTDDYLMTNSKVLYNKYKNFIAK